MSSNSLELKDTPSELVPWERRVLAALRGLRFGSVEVVIHDGRIVQIERREKVRLEDADRRQPDDRKREPNDIGRADRISGSAVPEREE